MIRHRRGFIDPSSGRPGSPHTAGAIQVQSGMRYGNPIRIRVTPGFIGSSFGIGATRSLPSEPENTGGRRGRGRPPDSPICSTNGGGTAVGGNGGGLFRWVTGNRSLVRVQNGGRVCRVSELLQAWTHGSGRRECGPKTSHPTRRAPSVWRPPAMPLRSTGRRSTRPLRPPRSDRKPPIAHLSDDAPSLPTTPHAPARHHPFVPAHRTV